MVKAHLVAKVLVAVNFAGTALGQIEWTKYPYNPVRSSGAQASVISDNDTLKMWFAYGMVDSLGVKVVVGFSISTDGISWTDHPGNPVVDAGLPGTWDSRVRDTPCVLKDSSGFKLWYTGAGHIGYPWDDSLTLVIGFASSTNGVDWSVHPEPVLKKGGTGSWERLWLESPTVLCDGDTLRMWYSGLSTETGPALGQIGYATSTDGISWEKHPSNPVVEVGGPGSGEDYIVGACSVIKTDSIYEMWYSAASQADAADGGVDTVNIGYASSTDGIHWEKYVGNPVMTTYYPSYDPDSGGPWAPSVARVREQYLMWYDSNTGVGLAIADSTQTPPREVVSLSSQRLRLFQNHPNPFRNSTTIRIETGRSLVNPSPETREGTLTVYNLSGQLVRAINIEIDRPVVELVWDGRDQSGKPVASGVYYYRAVAGSLQSSARKLLRTR